MLSGRRSSKRFPTQKVEVGGGSKAGLGAIRVTELISRAHCFTDGFAGVWNSLAKLDEGIVFKDPAAKLAPCVTQLSNGTWQVKVRRPHSNYAF